MDGATTIKSCRTRSPATASGQLNPLKLYGIVAMTVTDITCHEGKKQNCLEVKHWWEFLTLSEPQFPHV